MKQTSKKEKGLIWLLVITFLLLVGAFVYFKYFRVTPLIQFTSKDKISAIILPWQNVLENEQKTLLNQVSENFSPQTIILISPNHLEENKFPVLSTDQNQKMTNAILEIDKDKIKKLNKNISINNELFAKHYQDSSLLTNINQSFPDAKLLPLILKSDLSNDQINLLEENLNQACQENCLLVAASDFSQNQFGSVAEIHDDFSIEALKNLDETAIYQADVESKQILALTVLWAKDQKTEKFNLVQNTNSGKLTNDSNMSATGFVLGDFETGSKNNSDKVVFMLAGDAMFDRAIDAFFRGDKLTDVVRNLGDKFFRGTNVSALNLEGPISATPIEIDTTEDNLNFNFPPKTPEVLGWLGINAVGLANNHTSNAGSSGLENTHKVLDQAGISWIGGPTYSAANSAREFGFNGKKMSIITLNVLSSTVDIEGKIQEEKQKGNFVLVYPHWGNEYQEKHSNLQANLAHSWVDAGADLVVGTHPHVIQDMEIYNSKPIIYSLGNFVFDQTFSSATKQGLVLAGVIDQNQIKLVFVPVVMKNLKTEPATGQLREKIIDKLKESAGLDISTHNYGYDSIVIN